MKKKLSLPADHGVELCESLDYEMLEFSDEVYS